VFLLAVKVYNDVVTGMSTLAYSKYVTQGNPAMEIRDLKYKYYETLA
jgi:hypothetical protein